MGRVAAAALAWALVVLLAPAGALGQQQEEEAPVFKVDVRLVRMLATVKNPQGQLVGGLEKGDFKIFDNGVEQEIAIFERRTEQPLSIAMVVDTSRSTERERRYELDSIRRFLATLLREGNERDEAALYSFNTEVTLHTDYTRDLRRLERGLRTLKSEGATAMFDSVYLAAGEMKKRDGRHVVLIVSDGADTASRVKFEEALEALHDVDAVLYAVLVPRVRGGAGGAGPRPRIDHRTAAPGSGENALATFAQWTPAPPRPAGGGGVDRRGIFGDSEGSADAIFAGVLSAGGVAGERAVSPGDAGGGPGGAQRGSAERVFFG
ncbi:MAG: VWA domain-containing protein [Bryobacteraceae bacterium]|nr:VWA domain-containing protein [Bryobacteraceae bacterium]